MDKKEKERRAKNFSEEEKSFLLDIVEKFVHIIENRNTTQPSIVLKRKTWNLIANLFNAKVECQRDGWQLRNLYSNMKKRATKDLEDENVHKLNKCHVRTLGIMSQTIPGIIDPTETYETLKNAEITLSDDMGTPDALEEIEVKSVYIPSISPVEGQSSSDLGDIPFSFKPSASTRETKSLLRSALISNVQALNSFKITDPMKDTSKYPNRRKETDRRKFEIAKELEKKLEPKNGDHTYTINTVVPIENIAENPEPILKRNISDGENSEDDMTKRHKFNHSHGEKNDEQLDYETVALDKEMKWFELNKILPLRREKELLEIDIRKTDHDIKKMELKIKELEYKLLYKKYEKF